MHLTVEQLQAIDNGEPVPLLVDGRECIVLTSSAYEQVRGLIEDWDPPTMQRQMAQMMAEDWNDPAMRVYDE